MNETLSDGNNLRDLAELRDARYRYDGEDHRTITRVMGMLAVTDRQRHAVVAWCAIPCDQHRREFFALPSDD